MTDRTLVIMRHAKAEPYESKRDIDRELTARGRADAHAGGAWLDSSGIHPDVVLCSPAARTRATWHEVAVGLVESADADTQFAPTVQYESDLYDGGVSAALDLIRGVDADATTVLLIGHNPTVSALSLRFDDTRVRPAGGLRTSGIAVHRIITSWADASSAELIAEHTPRA